MIKRKANEFAKSLGINNFYPSDGYFRGLKKRNNIYYSNLRGESDGVDGDKVKKWKEKLQEIIKEYDANDIYNCDETSMYWRLLPTRTFSFKDASKKGNKKAFDRVTILLMTNMNGTDKSIFVIGKSKKPYCFNGIDLDEIYKIYSNQPSAWMDRKIFTKIINNLNNKMKIQKRNILLFLDNFSAHLIDNQFSNVKLIFFPSSTTSVLQPLDQGIITNFKHFYRNNLISFMINKLEESEDDEDKEYEKINLLQAINFMKSAWLTVDSTIILNCFKRAFFQFKTSIEIEFDNEEWEKLKQLKEIKYKSYEDYLDVDLQVEEPDDLTDEQIIKQIKGDYDDETEIEDELEEANLLIKPSSSEAFKSIQILQNYFGFDDDEINHNLKNLQNKLNKKQIQKLKQAKITHYFH